MPDRNITYTPTRYPAPTYYRLGPNGEKPYYIEAEAEAADEAARLRRRNSFTAEQLRGMAPPRNKAMSRAEDNLGKRTCPECGNEYTPAMKTQVVCGPACKRVRQRRQERESRARSKAQNREVRAT